MFAYFQTELSWKEIVKKAAQDMVADDATGLAAQLAYYFFLAVFPALLFLLAVASFFPLAEITDQLPRLMGSFAAPEMVELLRHQLEQLSSREHGGLLSLGLIGALWSSSAAMVSIIGALNRAYDIDEGRPWWRVRLTAILLTIGTALFILISFTLVVAGPDLADVLASRVGLGAAFTWTWNILQWPFALALVIAGLGLIYYFAPDAEQDWVWVSPGAVLATLLWLVASLGFRFYVVNFANYRESYGAVGAIILLMLWFYLTGLAIIAGAELNAEIEHASPWAKAPGEKVPGRKRKIGAAAARAYHDAELRKVAAHDGLIPRPLPPQPRTRTGALARVAVLLAAVVSLGKRTRA